VLKAYFGVGNAFCTRLGQTAKIQQFAGRFLQLGHKTSLCLVIFAELFCSLFIVLGLFTRLTVVPLIITMLVVIFGHNAGKPWTDSEQAYTYLAGYLTLLFCGPGKASVDGMMNKQGGRISR